jgi:D-serine deaminase-like pyridoxal phosphate-dependent protein
MDRAAMSIIVDNLDVAVGWSEKMTQAGRTLDVLVKVDVGFHRCGIDPDATDSVAFIQRVADLKGLRLRGLLSHAGHGYSATSDRELEAIAGREVEILRDLRDRVARAGVAIEEISVGATPTLRYTAAQSGPTEWRPGNYVYFDRSQVGLGAATLADCAMTVLATVVSTPAPDRVVLDCGSKTLTTDTARGFDSSDGFGAVLTDEGAIDGTLHIERLSEEHATVRVRGARALRPGDRVRVLPNHACVVTNLVDAVQLVEGDKVIDTLSVAARGKIT